MFIVKILCFAVCILFSECKALKFRERKLLHRPRLLANSEMLQIADYYDENYFSRVLKNILVPRVVGTEGHEKVKSFILDEMKNLGLAVEEHTFQDTAPRFGELKFTNLIGRLNPSAKRFLTLACHYDSKYLPPKFDAATDSAVPCAMMLTIVKSLQPQLTNLTNSEVSLKLIFFDGEEAFVEWNDQDSIYGSRKLASDWHATPFPAAGPSMNVLDSIDVLVLLDLLGAKSPKLYSFFTKTQRLHSILAQTERRLKSVGGLPARQPLHFMEKSTYSAIQDDHLPFLHRDVPILHLIPIPFPDEWHTPNDDYSILDFPTIASLTKVLQVFVISYLEGNVRI